MTRSVVVLSVFCIGLAGCRFFGRDVVRHDDVPNGCTGSRGISVLTYNAALAPGLVSYATPREPLVLDALAKEDFDVLCLQEVWEDDAKRAVQEHLALPSENVFWAVTSGQGETGEDRCTAGEISGMAECIRKNCSGLPDEEMSICAIGNCRLQGVAMYLGARKCLNCLIANAGHSIDEAERVCVDAGGASRLYHGQNGVMLVSRHPLRNTESIALRSSGANRVALFATIDTGVGTPVEIACTHLSSKSYTSPTHPDFSDWHDEQAAQITDISRRLLGRASGRPALLVGDLNIGRKDGFLGAHMQDNWDLLTRLGYQSPVAEVASPFCSSCAENPLRGSSTNYLIDHVLIHREDGVVPLVPLCAERRFDAPISVRPTPDAPPVDTRLSDHYGVKVLFGPRVE